MESAVKAPARAARWRAGGVVIFVVVLAALVLFPQVVTDLYLRSIFLEILVFGIFAMSLDLLMGYTGLTSFGHAAFFGLGAYTAGILGIRLSSSLLVTLPSAIIVAAVGAAIIGFLSIRAAGVYFLFLTLAFAQMVYAIIFQWTDLTGGSNGLAGVPRPTFVVGPLSVDLSSNESFYFLVAALFLATYLLLRRVVDSPFGHVLVGIRENEARMRAIGYNVRGFKLASFILAGALGGMAGALLAYYNNFASTDQAFWTTSGELMIMVIIGGVGTLVGPVLGAAVVVLLKNLVSSVTDLWPAIMGGVFVFFVLAARHGLVGLFRSAWGRIQR